MSDFYTNSYKIVLLAYFEDFLYTLWLYEGLEQTLFCINFV